MSVIEIIPGTRILLRGQVRNSLTGAGLAAELSLEHDQGAGFRPLPFPIRQQPGGWFAISARLSDIAARLRIGQPLTLRLTANAPGHRPGVLTRVLTAAQFARVTGSITVKGVAVPVDRIAAAPVILDLVLPPRAVMLAGIVLADNDPATPVSGARVRITGPGGMAVTTNAAGRFRFDAPPLALTLPLRVTKGARVTVSSHITDFATPVNFITLNLSTP